MTWASTFFKSVAASVADAVLKTVRPKAAPRSPAKGTPSKGTASKGTGSTGTASKGTATKPRTAPKPPTPAPPADIGPARPTSEAPAKGQFGTSATVAVDPSSIGKVRMTYSPSTDGDPDPGEIVWTWVPYEENDGRGKDRPVLVVAAERGGTVLVVQLTSKTHNNDNGFVALGAGPWDAENRPSWVNLERVLRVWPDGMRREATALDGTRYARVEAALRDRYGWS